MRQPELFASAPDTSLVAGVDEAGRGPLAGPVFAAAVILDPDRPPTGLADSKTLTAVRREALAGDIRQFALAWCVAQASVEEIDRLNILQATMLAMQRACAGLSRMPTQILIDGNRLPRSLPCLARVIVKGDALIPAISAASILAKVARDEEMLQLHGVHPQYGFDRHKGYPTAQHLAALAQHGALPQHRRSFGPVAEVLAQGTLF